MESSKDPGLPLPPPPPPPPPPAPDSGFPLDSVLASLAKGFPPGKPLAVLLSTGAMNPIHYGHVAVLDAARAAVEARGYHVLGGFISPTHDAYVGPKCASKNVRHFLGAARVSLVDSMLRDSTWLRTARWEVAQAGFEDFPQVFYACGEDHYKKCWHSLGRFHREAPPAGVVCVPRAGETLAAPPTTPLHLLAEAPPAAVAGLSSTLLRKALEEEGDLSPFVPAHVAEQLARLVAPPGEPVAAGGGGGGPRRRACFISLSALLSDKNWERVPPAELEGALFFFGSKRFWLDPKTPEQRAESQAQGPGYTTAMPPQLRALIAEKDARGEVCFLKPDVLGKPDEEVFGDYSKASAWLEGLGYGALRLQRAWWLTFKGPFKFSSSGQRVADNFERGLHNYNSVLELLAQSCPLLTPVLRWPPP